MELLGDEMPCMNEYVAKPDDDVRAIVVRSEHMTDWWTIERAEHPNARWMKPVEYGSTLMYSGRISDACVEGTSMEMIELAAAIENGESESFKRCAVQKVEGGYLFSSPRNSQHPGFLSLGRSLEVARDIRAKVVRPPVTEQ
jgi:hypothetical protein